ncbi:type 1 glutamine amidotransferase domain-containing protein [Novipirellula caenicola]|uniref:Cysteine protease YraA n=1 Tax=Novipirellula caenicola TaxID=1536901 RepID=A0ABP9VZ41_9BACT
MSSDDFPLSGRRILILVGEIYEDLELWYPKLRLEEAGASTTIAGPAANQHYNGKHGYPCTSDAAIADMAANDFDALIVPGGFMPDKLRRDLVLLQLVRDFDAAKKPIAAICHGGWITISAGVYRGVRVTGSPGIKDDLVNAGATYEDQAVVVDGHHISSRRPDDLPEFCRAIIQMMSSQS